MSFRALALAAAALAFAAPLAAQQPAPTPSPTPPKKPRPICRQIGKTGSHFVNQVCHTAEEWAKIDAEASGFPHRNGDGSYAH